MPFWVYILRCADNSYYVGHTDDLEGRLNAHEAETIDGYTQTRRPVRLMFCQEFPTRDEAFAAERRIKGWSRKKKEALIERDWDRLRRFARGYGRGGGHPSTSSG